MFDIDRNAIIHVFGEELLRHSQFESNCNRVELMESYICACFHCGTFFFPEEIIRWKDGRTAICPHCNWNAVLPDSAHLPLTPEYLAEMKKRWCRPS